VLGIGGSSKGVIASQPPPPPIFIPGEAVADAKVPSQSLAAMPAIETNHIVMAYRLPDRHSRSPHRLRLWRLAKLTERPMY
jgi:hypothetical protein